jgi:tetrahydromethanopterin S-methyltransferase subunit G
MSSDDYRAVIRRLTTLDDEAAAHRAEAVAWHEDRVASVDDKVRAAEETVAAARQASRAAQRGLEEVDAEAANLWSEYVHRVGPRAERFGRKMPEPTVPHQRSEMGADDYLNEVRTKVAWIPPAKPLTGATTIMFALFGFIGGVLGMAAHQLLRWAAASTDRPDWQSALPVVALIAMLLGPVIAVAGAKRVADRRGVDLDAAAVATVLITGLVTAGLLYTFLQRS